MMTEIWMSGEDLAVSRRIPRDCRSAQHSYDEVAQSMVNIAESRYQGCDDETAEWLYAWARELTDGRIGNNPRTVGRGQQFHEFPVPSKTHSDLSEGEDFTPCIQDLDPTELAIEWPISAFTDESTWEETLPIALKSELLRGSQRPDDKEEFDWQQETDDERSADGVPVYNETRLETDGSTVAAAHLDSSAQSSRVAELVVDQRKNPRDNAGRQVALAPTYMQQDFAKQFTHAAPNVPTGKPTMLAVSCFAAGVACCFVLHTLLLLTPVRLTVCRPITTPNRSSDNSSAQVTLPGEQIDPVRAVAFAARPQTPISSQQRDQASSMVEQFYSSNVELFERFAQPGD